MVSKAFSKRTSEDEGENKVKEVTMGYKVYLKDKSTNGRFVQWDGKNRSKVDAVIEMQRANKKYKHLEKQFSGKQHWQIRKVHKPRPQGFNFGMQVPSGFRMRI